MLTFSGSATIMCKSIISMYTLPIIDYLPKKALGIFLRRHFTIGGPKVKLGTKCLQKSTESVIIKGMGLNMSAIIIY